MITLNDYFMKYYTVYSTTTIYFREDLTKISTIVYATSLKNIYFIYLKFIYL